MTELEQKKLDAIHKVLDNYTSIGGFEQSEIAEELLSALSQFDEPKNIIETTYATGEIIRYQPCEPLEVEIIYRGYDERPRKWIVWYLGSKTELGFFETKQKAIDFCKRHGLKIKE